MAIPYINILKGVALRADQLGDGDAADQEATYSTATMAAFIALLDGIETPASALRQDILATEKEIAHMIGNSKNPILRASLLADSDFLVPMDDVPAYDDGGVPFVGEFDGVFDRATGYPLTEQDETVVRRYMANAGGFWKSQPYHYSLVGQKLIHTVTEAYFRGCSFDEYQAAALYDTDDLSVLPAQVESLWIHAVLGRIAQDNAFQELGVYYNGLVQAQMVSVLGMRNPVVVKPQVQSQQQV